MARSFQTALICTAIVLSAAGSVGADEPIFYGFGGPTPLIKSDTEFVVELENVERAGDVRASALDWVTGVLKPVPGMTRLGQYAILEVVAADRSARTTAAALDGVVSVRPVYRFEPAGIPYLSTGEIAVSVKSDLTDEARAELFEEYALEELRSIHGLTGAYVVRPAGDSDDEVAVAAKLHQDDRVRYAHPNFRVKVTLRQSAPDDEFFDEQWHLENTGQRGGVRDADIDVLDAWEFTLGDGVKMGLFDDAIDVRHEDLNDQYAGISQNIRNKAETEDAATPIQIGDHHGTAVAGLMCASANEIGMRGVAPAATFTCSRGLNETASFDELALPFIFALEQNVWVHNNSWGIPQLPPTVVDAIGQAFEDGRNGLGMVILFSSGNEGRLLAFGDDPSTLPTVIGIGGSTAFDFVSFFSNYGPQIDVLAPTDIFDIANPGIATTDVEDRRYVDPEFDVFIEGYNDDLSAGIFDLDDTSYTLGFGGTSASCPIASGVAALILAVNPNLTATQVRVIMEHTCDRIQAEDPDDPDRPGDAEYDGITGRSLRYGYGRLNAGAAVAAASAALNEDPPNLTWPDRPANFTLIDETTLVWERNDDLRTDNNVGDRTVEFIVAESIGRRFEWQPEDGRTYSVGDTVGDSSNQATITQIAEEPRYTFSDSSSNTKFVGVYARNEIGRYSWGVEADSTGVVNGEAITVIELPTGPIIPRVTVTATPANGRSPLTVLFRGNAQTDSPIATQLWDFGDGNTDPRSTTSHTYSVADGSSGERFEATFTVTDRDGDTGAKSVIINVAPPGGDDNGNGSGDPSTVQIEVTDVNGATIDTSQTYPAPFRVFLSVDISQVNEFVPEQGVTWFFGDGTLPATSRAVTHVYETSGQFPATVEVTTISGAGVVSELTDTVVILTSGSAGGDNSNGNNNSGGGGTPPNGGTCGIGILLPFAGVFLMSLWRRRFR